MRLLNVETFELEEWWTDIPEYAILSHTWLTGRGADSSEFTYDDIIAGTKPKSQGYQKILDCCEQAKKDKIGYIWADTCCIDKRSSSELQEAINSMFALYKRSAVCYAYLSDYRSSSLEEEEFRNCRWITRGWTLQELIAPRKVVFFNASWGRIGTKADEITRNLLSKTTKISAEVLNGSENSLKESLIAQKMSWASKRKTTRPEDIAYCLMGIFGVHISLLYGEGAENAFLRLQEEIMKRSNDHSLFAWRGHDKGAAGHGFLASSPEPFEGSSRLVRIPYFEPRSPYAMTNCGLGIKLSLT
ncbi:HET-domain-containing protein, partial [Hyaloscypha variabilis F]